ncbi:Prefoldin alpha subunit [Meredithblackwellia eburnea MCA 4105]
MSAPAGQVSLEDLAPDQLRQVQSQLEEELKHLTQAFGNLKAAQAKFSSCMDALEAIKPANKDKKILIPLTSSLYVPGRIKDAENVIVDVGTGYFVEKPSKAAKTLYNTKILDLRKNLSTLQEQIERKNDNARAVQEVLRVKLAQEQRAQQATTSQNAEKAVKAG